MMDTSSGSIEHNMIHSMVQPVHVRAHCRHVILNIRSPKEEWNRQKKISKYLIFFVCILLPSDINDSKMRMDKLKKYIILS